MIQDMIGGMQGTMLLQALLSIMLSKKFWAQFKTYFPIACISNFPYLLVLLQFYVIFMKNLLLQ
jgi:hypothetical protein